MRPDPARTAPSPTAAPLAPIASVMPVAGDFVQRDVHFASGEVLPALRIHYLTLGTPKRDARGTRRTRSS